MPNFFFFFFHTTFSTWFSSSLLFLLLLLIRPDVTVLVAAADDDHNRTTIFARNRTTTTREGNNQQQQQQQQTRGGYNGNSQLPLPDPDALMNEPAHYRLERMLMTNYNNRLIPRRKQNTPIQVLFTIGLYQIIEVNEPQQYILLNSWIVERWKDELLYWDMDQFEGIREIVLPRESVWIPDTTLYNSLVMADAESRRIQNVKVNTIPEDKSALIEMLYPTLYQFSCMLDLRFFPFDIQHCVMTFGSWIHDNQNIDYFAYDDLADRIVPTLMGGNGSTGGEQGPTKGGIGIEHCIPNEGWNILSTDVARREVKFHCCENNYTLLEFKLHIQRKPLFYLVNLIIPTSIITLIAIVGFFSSSTVNDMREEKISLGITTLLSMSILIFMVSDKMPSTSSFIPLIGWFYTSMMALISGGTLAASFVIYVQKKGIIGQRPSRKIMFWARWIGRLIWMEMPLLMKQAYALKAKQDKMKKLRQQLQQMELQQQKRQSAAFQRANVNQFGVGVIGEAGGGTATAAARKPYWWQPKSIWQPRQQSQDGAVGPRYRTETNGSAAADTTTCSAGAVGAHHQRSTSSTIESPTNVADHGTTTSFVAGPLGNAIAFMMPTRQKVSMADSLTDSLSVPAAASFNLRKNSINEENPDEISSTNSSSSRSSSNTSIQRVTKEGGGGGGAAERQASKKASKCSDLRLHFIDTTDEDTLKRKCDEEDAKRRTTNPPCTPPLQPRATTLPSMTQKRVEASKQHTTTTDKMPLVELPLTPTTTTTTMAAKTAATASTAAQQQQPPSPPPPPTPARKIPRVSIGGAYHQFRQSAPNLANSLVSNVTATIMPPANFVQSMIQRVQQRERERERAERERIVVEMDACRRATAAAIHQAPVAAAATTFRHHKTSSIADPYVAASLFTSTPTELTAANAQDPGNTLAEASASLSMLQPQMQRNLAEIEYDWLAAVLERMFLIVFSSLFFLTSFGINGIGLYYWYFTYVDLVEKT